MRRLIVNADDLGWSGAVNRGIFRAHREGVLTSATLMTALPGAEEALREVRREAPGLAIGVHLTLTEGRPLAPSAGLEPLLDGAGEFRRSLAGLFRAARDRAEVREAIGRELDAQLGWARDHGLAPSHLDSHKHVHVHPVILPVVLELARRHGVPAIRTTAEITVPHLYHFLPDDWGAKEHLRQWILGHLARRWGRRAQAAARKAGLATTDWFFGVRATGGVSAWLLQHLLQHAPDGSGELMVHPGLPEEGGGRPTRLLASRPRELEALCDPKVRLAAQAHGWAWGTYKDLNHD